MNLPEAAQRLGLAEATHGPGRGNYVHRRTPAPERFAPKVRRGAPDECWVWLGSMRNGYGNFLDGDGVVVYAHRFAWEQRHGPIPDGLHVLHRCDNPQCVNVAHLYLGTNADNIRDKLIRGRQSRSGRKLTAEDVERIRSDTARSMASFARELGVTITVISRVRRGVSYRSGL